ncbi:MAG TPA: hypothetical protein VFD58_21295 [Blastocatellia bacterium]|nr:hypothetical protein [Blastocatellia bacterium]
MSSAQGKKAAEPDRQIDLTRIGHISSKGRVQDTDYNQLPVVDRLIEKGTAAIPYLISKLGEKTELKGNTVDFWAKVTVGDVALFILMDFFTDSGWKKTTIPGVGWDEMLERRNPDLTAEQVLREYEAKHGRRAIKAKWQKIWNENKDRLYWDKSEKCFRVRIA